MASAGRRERGGLCRLVCARRPERVGLCASTWRVGLCASTWRVGLSARIPRGSSTWAGPLHAELSPFPCTWPRPCTRKWTQNAGRPAPSTSRRDPGPVASAQRPRAPGRALLAWSTRRRTSAWWPAISARRPHPHSRGGASRASCLRQCEGSPASCPSPHDVDLCRFPPGSMSILTASAPRLRSRSTCDLSDAAKIDIFERAVARAENARRALPRPGVCDHAQSSPLTHPRTVVERRDPAQRSRIVHPHAVGALHLPAHGGRTSSAHADWSIFVGIDATFRRGSTIPKAHTDDVRPLRHASLPTRPHRRATTPLTPGCRPPSRGRGRRCPRRAPSRSSP